MRIDSPTIAVRTARQLGTAAARGWVCALALFAMVIGQAQPSTTADGFALPQAGKQFTFPRDHGSHPEFKIEWWYVTGHLTANDSAARRFGFQATFFRQAGPKAKAVSNPSFATDHIYLAHMALINV